MRNSLHFRLPSMDFDNPHHNPPSPNHYHRSGPDDYCRNRQQRSNIHFNCQQPCYGNSYHPTSNHKRGFSLERPIHSSEPNPNLLNGERQPPSRQLHTATKHHHIGHEHNSNPWISLDLQSCAYLPVIPTTQTGTGTSTPIPPPPPPPSGNNGVDFVIPKPGTPPGHSLHHARGLCKPCQEGCKPNPPCVGVCG